MRSRWASILRGCRSRSRCSRSSTTLDPEHPDAVEIRRATAHVYKSVKLRRRSDKRASHHRRGRGRHQPDRHRRQGPDRRRDRAASRWRRPRRPPSSAPSSGPGPATSARTATARSTRSTTSSAPPAPPLNWAKRDEHVDLTGRRALLTGGRAKIGMYIALRLLRDGAELTITTRFPHDAVRRFTAMPRQRATGCTGSSVVGIDLRDPTRSCELADASPPGATSTSSSTTPPRRYGAPPASYAQLAAAEHAAEATRDAASRSWTCAPPWPRSRARSGAS